MIRRSGLRIALTCLLWLMSARCAPAVESFDYLYVEPNSGAAGGGHAAIRFADDVYHFQHVAGIVRAVHDPSEHFDYVYRALGNRSVHATRVEVSGDTYEALRETFQSRLLIEDAQVAALDSARRDRGFLEYIARHGHTDGPPDDARQSTGVRLRGAGYFAAAGAVPEETETAAELRAAAAQVLDRIARAIRAKRGRDYLEERARAVDREITELSYECRPTPKLVADRLPDVPHGYADAYSRLALARIAVDVLRGERVPVARAFRFTDDPSFRLAPTELAELRASADALTADVIRLVDSVRPDWGFPVLVAVARLVAVEATLRSGTLVVLDVYDSDTGDVTAAEIFGNGQIAASLLAEARADFARARSAFFSHEPPSEELRSRLEVEANRLLELERGWATGAALRPLPDPPVPSRGAALDPSLPLPALGDADLDEAHTCARENVRALRAELDGLYRYDLVSRNCVTEIFQTLDAAMAGGSDAGAASPASVRAESERALGGHIDAREGLNFVPFVSSRAVNEAYRVTDRTTLPSYRRYWLERLRSERAPFATRLRESNVLTSKLYRRGDGDDVFLFFTDDAHALRPLYGAANVLVDAGAVGAGVVALAFDHGRLLTTAARSFAFSVPELFFVSLRKGYNPTLPQAWTAVTSCSRQGCG